MNLIFLTLLLLFQATLSSSTTSNTLNQGSSLSVENADTDVLVSPNGDFSAGFFPVGENAFSFAIWFTKSSVPTVVWMANRDQPVNGRRSKLSLTEDGDLVLLDVGRVRFWSTETTPSSHVKLQLYDSGNLVLRSAAFGEDVVYWESFESPTDTLLPNQNLTMNTRLVASVSRTNYSSGYYHFYFDDDNTLRLRFQGPDRVVASVYWPAPWLGPFQTGRFRYNISKSATINSIGDFASSDNLIFSALDHGAKINRRLTLDPDGNLRLYSFDEKTKSWTVTWQAISSPCNVHGICGPNSMCSYDHVLGRSCSCVPGYKVKDSSNWAFGCEPRFEWRHNQESSFHRIANAEFYGYDKNFYENLSLKECEEKCLFFSDCKGIQYHMSNVANPGSRCYTKHLLVNGAHTSSFPGDVHVRLPKDKISYFEKLHTKLKSEQYCSSKLVLLDRTYNKAKENGGLKVLLWVAIALAGVEITCVSVVLSFLYCSRKESKLNSHGYTLAALTRFQKFTYAELRKATAGFCNTIGAGGGGTVYKGVLADGRVAAIKRLTESNGGEAEFLAEVSTIGRLNHMNLIEIWGYCAEGRHRLLVYEYMEHGSLADNLKNIELDWEKRFDIAMGTSKGLAYLHEECLEWVLHCDVKPENILLDSNYNAKVADFGLSKLLNRGECHDPSFSRIRGTRGYMAPEWVYNLPITSKVDVYSYGMVVIKLVTGREMADQHGRLVTWVKEKMYGDGDRESRIEEILDPMLELGEFDKEKIKLLVKVALQCVEEDKDARPSMKQIVEMLEYHNNQH
ncbi:putative receptor protein kinase ZmPK1 [Humulus lupulus]|uniref:putative receptor protein kinase ZmPK1 n=1 Tax=Humulus lupulus TaxID=3486 RepID=UPI002B40C11D|nr:putative receptor protein kinase ZmPK1 [Humulus lupulus]